MPTEGEVMKNRSTLLRRTVVVGLLAASSLVFQGVGTAHAGLPTGCNAGLMDALTGSAYCQGGTGQFRVHLICDRIWPLSDAHVRGPWQRAGGSANSMATCPYFQTTNVRDVSYDLFGSIG
jgi:hypothetical protein